MLELIFAPYDDQKPLLEQKSNIAYMMLVGALMNTQEKPNAPKRPGEWVRMAKLFAAFDKLEVILVERGPNGEKIDTPVLRTTGGEITLEQETFELLQAIWEKHCEQNLTLRHARQKCFVDDLLKNAIVKYLPTVEQDPKS